MQLETQESIAPSPTKPKPTFHTNATKKEVIPVQVEGKNYFLDPENCSYYIPYLDENSSGKLQRHYHLMSLPYTEEMLKVHAAIKAILDNKKD